MRSALNCKLLEDPNGSIKGRNVRPVIKHPTSHASPPLQWSAKTHGVTECKVGPGRLTPRGPKRETGEESRCLMPSI